MNKILIAIIAAGFGTQLIKMIIYYFQHKRLSLNDIFVTGGMPSSHSAFVVSLTTAIYLQEGASTAFAISLVLALIIIRDAFGVRRTVGKEGQALQKLFKIHKNRSTTISGYKISADVLDTQSGKTNIQHFIEKICGSSAFCSK